MKRPFVWIGLGLLLVVAAVLLVGWLLQSAAETVDRTSQAEVAAAAKDGRATSGKRIRERPAAGMSAAAAEADGTEKRPPSEDKDTGDDEAEERLVNAFDDLTDRWTEDGGARHPTLKDVEEFVRVFKTLPASRREECLQRALNLVPDENVLLLTGILMDKTLDAALLELAFNDILNRDEDVKNPILLRICADKAHPCREDAAWILDATDGEPSK